MITVDAHVVLSEDGCERELMELERLGFKLIMADLEDHDGACARKLQDELLGGRLRYLVYMRRRGDCREPCIVAGSIGSRAPEILMLDLEKDGIGDIVGFLRRYPNRVRAMVVDFSQARLLYGRRRLDFRKVRAIVRAGLRHRAPLLVGSGAKTPDEILGFRVLTSLIRIYEQGFGGLGEYRALLEYLYSRAAMAELG